MITMVQNLFGDTTEAQVTRAFITTVLNAGQKDVARKTRCLERRSTTLTVSGTPTYDIPDDYISIDRLKYNTHTIPERPFHEASQDEDQDGVPEYFTVFGRTLFLYPTPNETGLSIELWYIKMPDDLSDDSDESELPSSFHEDVVRYALSRCKEVDEQDERALQIMGEYENRLIESKSEVFDERMDSYPSVRALPGDSGGDYY